MTRPGGRGDGGEEGRSALSAPRRSTTPGLALRTCRLDVPGGAASRGQRPAGSDALVLPPRAVEERRRNRSGGRCTRRRGEWPGATLDQPRRGEHRVTHDDEDAGVKQRLVAPAGGDAGASPETINQPVDIQR